LACEDLSECKLFHEKKRLKSQNITCLQISL
jgi:hypothetical protein